MFRSFVVLAILLRCQDGSSAEEGCVIPSEWKGTWFQKDVAEPITNTSNSISHKGICRGHPYSPHYAVHRYGVEEEEDSCFRILAMRSYISKDTNVLSYTQTECSSTMEG